VREGSPTPGKFCEIFDAKSRVWGQFGPEGQPNEGQPNEYDVICRNASVLADINGAPFRFQNICWNGVPRRSRTTTSNPGYRERKCTDTIGTVLVTGLAISNTKI